MIQIDVTLKVIPPCHLLDPVEVRTVTLNWKSSPRLGLLEPTMQDPVSKNRTRNAAYGVRLRV
jgi:hypothetical protein